MIRQKDPVATVCNRHHAISILFTNDPHLLRFFFTKDRLGLRWEKPRLTRLMARLTNSQMGREEVVLVDIALSIWMDGGSVKFSETYRFLAHDRFYGLLSALELLYRSGGCKCQNCSQRLSAYGPERLENHQ